MKKYAVYFSALIAATSSLLGADQNTMNPSNGQGQMMNQSPNCSQLSADEQNFASQLMDMNNKSMFCSKFSAQQRQQSMQMMGTKDASGNMMTADQAVQQMSGGMMAPATKSTKPSTNGGCPVQP